MSELNMMLFGKPYPIPHDVVRVVKDATAEPPKPMKNKDVVLEFLRTTGESISAAAIAEKTGIGKRSVLSALRTLQKKETIDVMYRKKNRSRQVFARAHKPVAN